MVCPKPIGKRRVLVGAAAERLVHEDMPRHVADAIQHREIRDALLAQALHQPVARARGGHADARTCARQPLSSSSQLPSAGSAAWRVRSICSGVTDT